MAGVEQCVTSCVALTVTAPVIRQQEHAMEDVTRDSMGSTVTLNVPIIANMMSVKG